MGTKTTVAAMKTKVTKGPAKPSRATKAIKPLTNINHPGPGLVALSPALATGFPSVDSTGAMSAIQTNNKNAGISTTVTVDNKGKTMANMPAATMTMQQQVKGDVQAQLQQAQASLAPVQHQVASVPIHPVQHIHHLQHHLPSQIHQQPQLGLQLQPSPLKNATAATQHQHQNQHQPVAEDSRPSNQAQQGTPITQQLPPNHPIVQQQQQQQQNPASPQQAVQAHLQNTFQSPYVTPGVLPIQQSPYAQPQDAAYYASHPSPRSTHSAPGPYSQAETSDLMAAAQMQRPYPPIYHTPQSNSPASVASPQSHEHQNRLYAQPPPPQMPQQMYTYSQYQPMNTVHSSYGPPQTPQTHPSMTSQPLLMQQTAAQIPQQQPQMTNSPRMKIESSAAQRPPPGPLSATHATPTAPTAPSSNMHSSPQSGGNGVNPNAAPGPIPATTPLVVRQDNNGVQWIAFEYSRDRVKMEYTIRCDVESVNVETLSQDFKTENCVYPRACCPKDQYRGNRLVYETECNTVGWALAELNPCLRGKRGLIQRAVDSWRNSNQDPRLRSRRVRRMAKMNTRKTVAGNQPPNHMAGPAGPGSVGVPGGPPGMAPQASRAPGSMGMAGPQLHHHHAHPDGNAPSGGEEVSGASPNDIRPGQTFHGYPTYPSSSSVTGSSMPSTVHDGMDIGRGPVGSNNAVAASAPATHRDEEDDNKAALFGDIPEAKRRKFILVDDTQRNARVRVRVQLDQINMSEVPDSYRRDNSVFPRSYFPMQMQSPPPSATGSGYFNDDEDERDGQPIKGKTMVKVTTLEGEDEVAVPRMSKRQRKKEVLLNDMGYRMSWSQSRVFAYRTIFLQKSLDAYRNKMRSSILANGQEVTNIASHFETRVGKRRWQERTRRSEHARTP